MKKVRNTQQQAGKKYTIATFQLLLSDLSAVKSKAKKLDITLSEFIRRSLKLV